MNSDEIDWELFCIDGSVNFTLKELDHLKGN